MIGVLIETSLNRPEWLSDEGNSFLKSFVTHELLSVLGVIVTITLASAANLHLEFNRMENDLEESFLDARTSIKAYAVMLILLFAVALMLTIAKPVVAQTDVCSAFFNSGAITIVVLNLMALADLTMAVFAIPPTARLTNGKR